MVHIEGARELPTASQTGSLDTFSNQVLYAQQPEVICAHEGPQQLHWASTITCTPSEATFPESTIKQTERGDQSHEELHVIDRDRMTEVIKRAVKIETLGAGQNESIPSDRATVSLADLAQNTGLSLGTGRVRKRTRALDLAYKP
jgi:hypothetical protein